MKADTKRQLWVGAAAVTAQSFFLGAVVVQDGSWGVRYVLSVVLYLSIFGMVNAAYWAGYERRQDEVLEIIDASEQAILNQDQGEL